MRDRVPLYSGRVKMVPVSGQENVYDMTRADQPTQQGDPLNKATLLKDSTAALFGLGTDAVPDDVLALLSKAALYKTITPTAQLGALPEGSIIYLNENGSPVPFYVAKQGYEPSHNTNRVLVVRKDAVQQGVWNSDNENTYDGSTIDTWFNQTYLKRLDSDVQTAISTTNIPYTPMGGTSAVQRISKAVFALSATEYGVTKYDDWFNVEGSPSYSGISFKPSFANLLWTRSPALNNNYSVLAGTSEGVDRREANGQYDYLPAFTLPTSFIAKTSENDVSGLFNVSNNLLLKLPGVQIATGSYVGTGKYYKDNPNSLTFEFEPKLVFIGSAFNNSQTADKDYFINVIGAGCQCGSINVNTKITKSGKSISWYNINSAHQQLNYLNAIYYYTAIG